MPFGRAHVLAALALFMAFVIESWEQLALVYVSGDLGDAFSIDAGRIGWVLSAVALGMIPGALVWGPVSDRIGRRAVCLWSLSAYGVIALASAFSPNFTVLLVTRVLSGLALAGIYTVTFPYFLELLPSRMRGRAAVYLSIGRPIGVLAAVGVTQLLAGLGRHVVAIASALAGFWVFAIRAWVPKSPYWLAAQNRHDDAAAVLRRLGADVPAGTRFEVVAPERAGRPVELLRGRLLRITLLMLVVNFTFNWGYWGLQTWLPTLLQDKGLSMSASLGFVALSALFMIPGYVSASLLTGRFGRKKVFLPYVALAAASGILFAYSGSMTELYITNFARHPVARGRAAHIASQPSRARPVPAPGRADPRGRGRVLAHRPAAGAAGPGRGRGVRPGHGCGQAPSGHPAVRRGGAARRRTAPGRRAGGRDAGALAGQHCAVRGRRGPALRRCP
ncbi:MFS transporter [Streptomyces atratus]|uniref:MFS transporter n=1 Tax=Streptomyces atratus TaxID=1893 RepID=UPI00225491AA|nr:MFS transporter [Streptomyces atratus]MCX5339689.1 MFS transporter [Streptomyces atratus]